MRAKSAIFSTAVVLAVLGTSSLWGPEAHGQAVTKGLRRGECERAAWVDAITGQAVASLPQGAEYSLHKLDFLPGKGLKADIGHIYDLDHAYNPNLGLTYLHLRDGNWIDEKTGACPLTFPERSVYAGGTDIRVGWNPAIDPNFAHNPNTGESFVHVPWPHGTLPPVRQWDPSDSMKIRPLIGGHGLAGFFIPDGYCYHWVDEDGDEFDDPVTTYHDPDNYDPFNDDPDEIHIGNHFYINVTNDDDDDDHWVNADTGEEVSTDPPVGDDDPFDDFDHIDVDGFHLIRVLEKCDEHDRVMAVLPGLLHGPDYFTGGNFGVIGRTAKYDDDYKVGGISPFIGVNTGITYPIGGHFFGGGQIGAYFPFQASTLEFTQTKLNSAVVIEGVFGDKLQCPHMHNRPYTLSGSFGAAIGIERSGSIATPSYSDREILPGITFSLGASLPVYSKPNRDLSLTSEFRYINLFQEKFSSPGGSYGMKDSGFFGDVGIRYEFNDPFKPKKK